MILRKNEPIYIRILHFLLVFALLQSQTVLQSVKDGFPLIGQLHFEDGAEPAVVEVELRDENASTVLDSATATLGGRFYFNEVKLGTYWIAIESERYQWVKHRLVVDLVRTFGAINLELSLYPRRVPTDGTRVVSLEALHRDIPKKAIEKLENAVEEFQKAEEKKGIDLLEEALEIAPDFFEAHLQLGFAHQRAGRREEAIASLTRADKRNSASAEATTWLGRLYFETERFQEAIDTLTGRLEMGQSAPTTTSTSRAGSSSRSGSREGREYPLILQIHGGPAGMYGTEFDHKVQVMAAHGYAMVYVNPRGSSEYGQTFVRANDQDWGGRDFGDIMEGVDTVLTEYDWIDRDRMAIYGCSYGGFMTSLAITQTDRFAAAAPECIISNGVSFWGTYDNAYNHEVAWGGSPWEVYDLMWERSPLKHARNVKTPALFIQGEADERTPADQVEQMFRALKRHGVETELVRYPGQNHGHFQNGKPAHYVDRIERILAWFDKYTGTNPPSS